jgi:putative glutamine amidotransferase
MNQQPPRIGIPARIQHPVEDGQNRHSHAYHFLEQTLAHWVMSHGAMLFMIPSLCEACLSTGKVLERYNYAGALDGLILQGGPHGIMEQPPLISGELRGGDELFSDRLTL